MFALAALVACGLCGPARADDERQADIVDSTGSDSLSPPSGKDDSMSTDSVMLEPILYQPGPDTLLMATYYDRRQDSLRKISPSLTMLKSVALPGWGQVSNGKYIKAGVIAVVESYFIYKAVDYGRLAADWRDKWTSEPDNSTVKGLYFSQYAEYRDTRNSFIWYTVITVFFSMIDAYVDAHLKNFPEDIPTADRLTVSVDPGRELRLALLYHF